MYLERIISDHDQTASGMRKALSFKEAVKVHQATGCFLYFLNKLKQICPEKDFPEFERGLKAQFMGGFLDVDLINTLEEQVPAASDVSSVKAFRPKLSITELYPCQFSISLFQRFQVMSNQYQFVL